MTSCFLNKKTFTLCPQYRYGLCRVQMEQWVFSLFLNLYLKFPVPSTVCLFLPSQNSLWVHASPATWYWGWDVGSGKPKGKPGWKCITKTSCLEILPWNYQNQKTVGWGQCNPEVIHFLWDDIDQKYPTLYHFSPHSQTAPITEYRYFQQGEIGLKKKKKKSLTK